MGRQLIVVTALLLTGAVAPAAQMCLHGSNEAAAERTRRQRAVQLATQINTQQRTGLRAPQYRPLEQLGNLPVTPAGFDVKLLTDGESYLLSLRDRRDPCNYAIFSDESGLIYEATADHRASVIPAGTR